MQSRRSVTPSAPTLCAPSRVRSPTAPRSRIHDSAGPEVGALLKNRNRPNPTLPYISDIRCPIDFVKSFTNGTSPMFHKPLAPLPAETSTLKCISTPRKKAPFRGQLRAKKRKSRSRSDQKTQKSASFALPIFTFPPLTLPGAILRADPTPQMPVFRASRQTPFSYSIHPRGPRQGESGGKSGGTLSSTLIKRNIGPCFVTCPRIGVSSRPRAAL